MKIEDGRQRVIIERVRPRVDCGSYPAKAVIGQELMVSADVFADGHDSVKAHFLYKHITESDWRIMPMERLAQDRWAGSFKVEKSGIYEFTVEGWIDHFLTWKNEMGKRIAADQDVTVDLKIGAELITRASSNATGADKKKLLETAETLNSPSNPDTSSMQALAPDLGKLMDHYSPGDWITRYDEILRVEADPPLAGFSSWYEMFPRSYCLNSKEHGNFKNCIGRLDQIAKMGFDIVYLPPIHPIGETGRKGKNNKPSAEPSDPGSPWAIGSKDGGHKAIHPDLGTMDDFKEFVERTWNLGMEVALDLAFQCSHDHPYIKEHPEWFRWRPDGTIQYAENPPKKYQDIVPLNFETENWRELWEELKSVVFFWIEKGVRIFRVDNPHTKPFGFWEWLIKETRKEYPDVFFLSEAFTRPSVKYRLAKIGFSQSYTYFTWRNSRYEITKYMNELTKSEISDFFRPNFWPNTPDILPEFLQFGGRSAFLIRIALAATLSANYGVYGPAFDLCRSEAIPGTEEYMNSEKYEIKKWQPDEPGNLRDFMTSLNAIRRENPALQQTDNITFHDVNNDYLLFYIKKTRDLSNVLFIVVNLDPFHTQSGTVRIPMDELNLRPRQNYLVYDLLGDDKYIWRDEYNYVELNPHISPIHIFRVHSKMRRESDFDYYL